MMFSGAEVCPFNISPHHRAPFHPSLSLALTLCLPLPQKQKRVKECQWQGLLHEQNASMLGANLSQLWGCGEQPFISRKQTRPITSSGGWCGQGGRGMGGDKHFFLLFCFVFLTSQRHPMICTHTNTQKNIGTHKNSPRVVLQFKEWQ